MKLSRGDILLLKTMRIDLPMEPPEWYLTHNDKELLQRYGIKAE